MLSTYTDTNCSCSRSHAGDLSIDSDDNDLFLNYNEVYGPYLNNSQVGVADHSVVSAESFSPLSPAPADITPIENFNPPTASTPYNLTPLINVRQDDDHVIEDNAIADVDTVFQPMLFSGSDVKVENFLKQYQLLCDTHKMSDIARKDVHKLFESVLPKPNNLFLGCVEHLMPLTTQVALKSNCSTLVLIDCVFQLSQVLRRNKKSVLESWSLSCSWAQPLDCFIHGEIQLVCNIDGAKVFRSKSTSIWPVWIQVYNLPPILRSSFSNIVLLSLWHGQSKPDFSELLIKLTAELDMLINKSVNVPEIGRVFFRLRSLVCDMPAKAAMLCMTQFNGYYGCPHCFMRGVSHQRRMLYPCSASFVLRENRKFVEIGKLSEHKNRALLGIKRKSPLCNILSFPWDAPIDPMHQVFLGTAKILSKSLLGVLKGNEVQSMSLLVEKCKVPSEFMHKSKRVSELNFWKASDYKLFFFHTGPLVFSTFNLQTTAQKVFESFLTLSTAIRLLYDNFTTPEMIDSADALINIFFSNFVEIYGVISMSFNFHSMRHLVEQVRRVGPLWCFTAFSFESCHYQLMSALSGSVKTCQHMVERFVKHKVAFEQEHKQSSSHVSGERDKCRLFTKVSADCLLFCSEMGEIAFYGRYKNDCGKLFASRSYSKLSENLSESIVQLCDGHFVQIETFVEKTNGFTAIVRHFHFCENLLSSESTDWFLFKLKELGGLQELDVKTLMFKCVVLVDSLSDIRVSVMREGFDHN